LLLCLVPFIQTDQVTNMKESNTDQASKIPTEQSNQVGSLEPDLPSFFLRRRKTNRSPGNLDNESPLISPSFGLTRSRPPEIPGVLNKSNLDASRHTSSGESSFSLGSRYPLNVSDWNEKVVRETKPEQQLRQMSDPPRPPSDGFEWVWFPEGYWAEREIVEFSPGKSKGPQKWFNRAPEHRGSSSNASKTSPQNVVPQIKIGSNKSRSRSKSQESSPRESLKFEEQDVDSESRSSGGSKLLRGLQQLSPTYPHFTSPTGGREGLYCRTKRGIESRLVVNQQKMVTVSGPGV
jgi:parafibromin